MSGATTGEQFLCHACNRLHDGLGEALACCSDAFDDPDLVSDVGTLDTDRYRWVVREAAEELRNFAAYKRGDGADSRADHLDELADKLVSGGDP